MELRVRFAEAGGLLALPPPAPSVDGDEELLLAEPLPPPLEFSNSFEAAESAAPVGDSTASSLTSYDSEVATLTQAVAEPRRGGGGLVTAVPPEGTEAVTDSGIEEVDSRSSSDHPPESAEPPPAFAALLEGPERARARGRPRGGAGAGEGGGRRGEPPPHIPSAGPPRRSPTLPWEEAGRSGGGWPRGGGEAGYGAERSGVLGRHR